MMVNTFSRTPALTPALAQRVKRGPSCTCHSAPAGRASGRLNAKPTYSMTEQAIVFATAASIARFAKKTIANSAPLSRCQFRGATATVSVVAWDVGFQEEAKLISTSEMGRNAAVHRLMRGRRLRD